MKNQRIIKKNFEFQRIISQQKILKNSSFVVYYSPSLPDESYLRYGLSVGKKLGSAPLRNRSKRQLRQMIKQALIIFGDKKYRIILIVRPDFLKNTFQVNQKNLFHLLSKLK